MKGGAPVLNRIGSEYCVACKSSVCVPRCQMLGHLWQCSVNDSWVFVFKHSSLGEMGRHKSNTSRSFVLWVRMWGLVGVLLV